MWLDIPGDNGETKSRPCIVLRVFPDTLNPGVVLLIAGATRTADGTRAADVVRVDTPRHVATIGLSNPTSFHYKDIRFFDAMSPNLKKRATCPFGVFQLLKPLGERRVNEGTPIALLPDKARDRAKQAADDVVNGVRKARRDAVETSGSASSSGTSSGGPAPSNQNSGRKP